MSRRTAASGLAVISVTVLLVSASCSPPAERIPGPTSLPRLGPPPPPPSNVDRTEWTLNTTLRAVSGPDNCFSRQFRNRIGEVLHWLLLVERSGTSLRLVYDVRNVGDNIEYRTTLEATRFSAEIDFDVTYPPCEGLSLNGKFVGRVTGAFSESGSGLTAVQEITYVFSWGEVELRYDWLAGQP